MLFCLSQRYHMRPSRALCVNHYNHFASQQAKADLARFALILPLVFTRDGEVVPNCIASGEVQPMILDVQFPLRFVPGEHV